MTLGPRPTKRMEEGSIAMFAPEALAAERGARARHAPAPTRAAPVTEGSLVAHLEGIARGSEAALGALYDATAKQAYALALRIVGTRESAEEVVSETFYQVWRDHHRYDPDRGRVLVWILTICRSRALDALRRRDTALVHPEPETLATNVEGGGNPQDLLVAMQEGTRLHSALQQMSAVQRQLLALAFFRGLSHAEIAAHTGLALGSVKSHIRRALLLIRERLGRNMREG